MNKTNYINLIIDIKVTYPYILYGYNHLTNIMVRIIILLFIFIISNNITFGQIEDTSTEQIFVLSQTKNAYALRKTCLLNKIRGNYSESLQYYKESFIEFMNVETMISNLISDKLEKSDIDYYSTILSYVKGELKINMEDILNYSNDKLNIYYTYIMLMPIKINSKLDALKKNQEGE